MLASDESIVERIRTHAADGTTDMADGTWAEPVEHYLGAERFAAETELLRRTPVAMCPGAAVAEPGSFWTGDSAGTPIVVTRSADGAVHALRNACRHRGAAVACGAGHAAALVCPYHGWVYRLDGALRRVSHDHGFPGLDRATSGLVELHAEERHGLVFVTQTGTAGPSDDVDVLGGVLGDDLHYAGSTTGEQPVNWKLLAETFLEGYHIRFLHHETFFPVQFDNLNTVETFGSNSRITFPFRNVLKPFDAGDPAAVRGRLTYVHHLFPNVMVITFPTQVLMLVLDPVAVDRTTITTHAWSTTAEATERDPGFVDRGAAEDFAIARTIQHGLASGHGLNLRFGRFEGAIIHFHRMLEAAIESLGR